MPTSRIGCLIGKGGAIVTEMRRATKANIRILSKDNLPKIASEDDEMVQVNTYSFSVALKAFNLIIIQFFCWLSRWDVITDRYFLYCSCFILNAQIAGDLDVAKDALIHVVTRLRANLFDREGAVSTFLPVLPYIPVSADGSDGLNYESRDNKRHGRGHSYSGGYGGSSDLASSDSYGSYGGSQVFCQMLTVHLDILKPSKKKTSVYCILVDYSLYCKVFAECISLMFTIHLFICIMPF